MTDDLAVHSKFLKQQVKMIWRLPCCFFRGGMHIEKDEEKPNARAGTYLGIRDER